MRGTPSQLAKLLSFLQYRELDRRQSLYIMVYILQRPVVLITSRRSQFYVSPFQNIPTVQTKFGSLGVPGGPKDLADT